jgi:carboxypeptidase Taq
MPRHAIEVRSLQTELMAGFVHQQHVGKKFKNALNKLIHIETGEIRDDRLSPPQIAALHQWRRDFLKEAKLPSAFVKKFAKTTSTATHAWSSAKKHNDFREFAPHLEKIVGLNRKKADLLGFTDHPYDALLDLFEPDMKTSFLVPLFAKLKLALIPFIQSITATPPIPEDFLFRHYPVHKQYQISHTLLKTMGFSETTSRLDHSAHPFCMGLHPYDTRMTTRIHPENLMTCIGSVIHEGGHGLYNMNLPVEQYGSPLGQQVSLGIDESQSRWWETLIGQSLPFWQHFFPLLQELFPEQLQGITLTDFHRAINIVKPSFIRVESDEVTYNLHVIVRFEIEKGLIEGTLKVREIPEIWNEKMREYLGVAPTLDGDGCLQDIHWSMGMFGYFPTYTLGNLYAVQFFTAFEKEHLNWQEKVAKGDLHFIRDWLRDKIHRYGRQFSPSELCLNITGQPLSEKPYLNYLEQKFKTIYPI